jgi:hypothetical protein
MQGMAAMGFQMAFVPQRQTYSYSVWRGKIRMERLFEVAENQIHRGVAPPSFQSSCRTGEGADC